MHNNTTQPPTIMTQFYFRRVASEMHKSFRALRPLIRYQFRIKQNVEILPYISLLWCQNIHSIQQNSNAIFLLTIRHFFIIAKVLYTTSLTTRNLTHNTHTKPTTVPTVLALNINYVTTVVAVAWLLVFPSFLCM